MANSEGAALIAANPPNEPLPSSLLSATSEGADHPWSYASPGSKGHRPHSRQRHAKVAPTNPAPAATARVTRKKRLPARFNSDNLAAAVQMKDMFALGDNGKPLTWAATCTSADRDLWISADDEEITRLVDEAETMCFIDAKS